jgi:hypothetical protein
MWDAMGGEAMDYLKKTIGVANKHYPERSFVIFLLNTPSWFNMLWGVLSVFIDSATQQKIRPVKSGKILQILQEHIDYDQIPAYYGGGLSYGDDPDSCRYASIEVKALNDFVRRVNRGLPGTLIEGLPRPHGGNAMNPNRNGSIRSSQRVSITSVGISPGSQRTSITTNGNGNGSNVMNINNILIPESLRALTSILAYLQESGSSP